MFLVVLHPFLCGLVEFSLDRTASPVLGGFGVIFDLVLGVLAEGGAESVLTVFVEVDDGVEGQHQVFLGEVGLEDVGQFRVEDVVEHVAGSHLFPEGEGGVAGGGYLEGEVGQSHPEEPHLGFFYYFPTAAQRLFLGFLLRKAHGYNFVDNL